MVFRGTIAVLKPLIPNYLIVVLRSDVLNKFRFFFFSADRKSHSLTTRPGTFRSRVLLKSIVTAAVVQSGPGHARLPRRILFQTWYRRVLWYVN